MLTSDTKTLLEKHFLGDTSISVRDIIQMQASKKRLPPKKAQCKRCVYRDCVYNNTQENDVPYDKNDWKGFNLFKKCFECKDRKEQ